MKVIFFAVFVAVASLFTSTLAQESTTQTTQPGFECPEPNGFYTDTANCSCFWRCVNGTSFHYVCPDNLYWNNASQFCDYTWNVPCGDSGSEPQNPQTTQAPASGEPQQTTQASQTPEFECPAYNGYYPDPNSQNHYYWCVDGYPYLMNCPENLYWNNCTDVCDYEYKVDCGSVTQQPETHTNVVTSSGEPEGTTGSSQKGSKFECPQQNGFYPDSTSCANFHECVNGTSYNFTCPAGLYWNNNSGECDYTYNVQCGDSTIRPSEAPASTPESPAGGYKCPTQNGTYINPLNCNCYFTCVGGAPIGNCCPDDLYYNKAKDQCDYPANVSCPSASA